MVPRPACTLVKIGCLLVCPLILALTGRSTCLSVMESRQPNLNTTATVRRQKTALPSLLQAPPTETIPMGSLHAMMIFVGKRSQPVTPAPKRSSSFRTKKILKTTDFRGCATIIVAATPDCRSLLFQGKLREDFFLRRTLQKI